MLRNIQIIQIAEFVYFDSIKIFVLIISGKISGKFSGSFLQKYSINCLMQFLTKRHYFLAIMIRFSKVNFKNKLKLLKIFKWIN